MSGVKRVWWVGLCWCGVGSEYVVCGWGCALGAPGVGRVRVLVTPGDLFWRVRSVWWGWPAGLVGVALVGVGGNTLRMARRAMLWAAARRLKSASTLV